MARVPRERIDCYKSAIKDMVAVWMKDGVEFEIIFTALAEAMAETGVALLGPAITLEMCDHLSDRLSEKFPSGHCS